MDISPSTVSTGDTITLRVTRSGDKVVPVEHECSLFLKGETEELASCLDAHEFVEAAFTVTNCMWAQSRGTDMLSVTVESCRGVSDHDTGEQPASEPQPVSEPESESRADGKSDDATASGQDAAVTTVRKTDEEADRTTDPGAGSSDVAADHAAGDTTTQEQETEEAATADVAADAEAEAVDAEAEAAVEAEAADAETEAAAVVEWDPDEPLDRDVLQRVLNRGQRVPQSAREELDYGDRNAVEIAAILIDLASGLEVSSPVCYRAAELYADAMGHDLVHGRSKVVTAAAAFRIATLQENEHRPIAAIAETLREFLAEDVHSGEIADQERRLISELDVDPSIVLIQPQKYLPYLARQLGIEEDAAIMRSAESFATRASSQGGGSSPWSIAAAAVYCAGRQGGTRKLTQRQVAQAANLSEVTIRNNYKTLLED